MEQNNITSKLMTPLFYDGSFNREGRKMRALFEREDSDGTNTYRLWRSAGKPDLDYPSAENDAYILHVQIGDYLAPLGFTDFRLIDHCGFPAAVKELYGGKEGRETYFGQLRTLPDADNLVKEAIRREEKEMIRFGTDPVLQAGYIKAFLDQKIETYQNSKRNGGESFPDFIGALALGELDHCTELARIHREKSRQKRQEEAAKRETEEQVFCLEQNRLAEQAVADAVQIIRTGGVLKNDKVYFYQSQYDFKAYSIINYLMRQFGVNVPLRTQGWINEKLTSITIKDGRCDELRFMRVKGCRCSEKVFECLGALVDAVQEGC